MIYTGLDLLLAEHLDDLNGLRVGIVANHASVTRDLVHIADALHSAGVTIAALFGPEHGARGDLAEGEHVADVVDSRLGVPVYSLYGGATAPSSEALSQVDVMLIDLQDIGTRFYTFIYTMADVMAACGKAGVPVWVLDRPNPITGSIAEGPVSDPRFSYASFKSAFRLPIRHGLTIGELAKLFVRDYGIRCDLRVIEARGWKREMYFDQTGLPWVMPSPNMPTLDTAIVYPGLCLLEGFNVSEGRGTTRPFEQFGAPWIDPLAIKQALLGYDLPGVAYRESYFTPYYSKLKGEHCAGVQLYVTDREAFRPVLTGVAITCAIKRLYPDRFEWRAPGPSGIGMFDILCGTDATRLSIDSGAGPWEIAAEWDQPCKEFRNSVATAKLY